MNELKSDLVQCITDFVFEQLWPISEHGLNHPEEVKDPNGLLLLRSVERLKEGGVYVYVCLCVRVLVRG